MLNTIGTNVSFSGYSTTVKKPNETERTNTSDENNEKEPIKAKSVFILTPDFYVAKYEDGMKRKYTLDGECLEAENSNVHRYKVDLNNEKDKEENDKYEKLNNNKIAELYDNGEYERRVDARIGLVMSMLNAQQSGDTKTFNELCDSLKDKTTDKYNLSIDD